MRGWHQPVSFGEVVVQVDFLKKIQARGGQCGAALFSNVNNLYPEI